MTDKPLYEQLVEIGAAKPEAWDEFCAEQHAINAEDHRRAEMVTIDRFEHWWDDGDHDDGPTPLGPLSKETARWIWRAALAAQPAEPLPHWQPIETAPSDTPVLLYTPQIHETTNLERIELRVYHDSRAGSRHAWATHWMPLPPAPKDSHDPR